MVGLISWAQYFAAFDSMVRQLQVMSYSLVAERLDDGTVELGERRDLLVGSQVLCLRLPCSFLNGLQALMELVRTSDSHWLQEGLARMVVGTAEPCQRQPDSGATSWLIGMNELGSSRSDHEWLAVWDTITIAVLAVFVTCTADVVVYIVVYRLLVG
jgi:hypothetical protein